MQPLESLISCGRKHAYSKAPVFLLVGSDGTLGGAFRDRSLKSRTPSGSNDYFGCGAGLYLRINQAYRIAGTNAEAEAIGLGMLLIVITTQIYRLCQDYDGLFGYSFHYLAGRILDKARSLMENS